MRNATNHSRVTNCKQRLQLLYYIKTVSLPPAQSLNAQELHDNTARSLSKPSG